MESSDHIIDIGPEAGLKGGQIVAEGEVKEIIKNDNSITGNYLSGKKFIPVPKKRRSAKNGRFIEISGASGNNLKKVNLKIPSGTQPNTTLSLENKGVPRLGNPVARGNHEVLVKVKLPTRITDSERELLEGLASQYSDKNINTSSGLFSKLFGKES